MRIFRVNMNKIKHIILIIFFLPVLYNCASLAVGAAVVAASTTAVVATDPRSSGAVVDDNTIEAKLQHVYNGYKDSNIYVNSYNGAILLTGQAATAKVRESAEFEAKSTPGVKQIYDYTDIRLPQSIASRTTDSYTTTQVRGKILNLSGVSSNSIKVVTTNNVVYLAGVVTKEQATQVANAAASVNGVEKVVTLFDYINR